jgi:hypothetical protein
LAQASHGEYEVKAAFVYNFARFVSWPEKDFVASKEDFVVGVLGPDPFGPVLDDLARDRTVEGSNLAVKRYTSSQGLDGCHILFISSAERGQLPEILRALGTSSVLTVSESEGFLEHGGMINLMLKEQKVRFEINVGAADKVGLKISSQLLKLATRVIDVP